MHLFRKMLIGGALVFLDLFAFINAKGQENHVPDLDSIISCFNQKALFKELGNRLTVVSNLDSKYINIENRLFGKIEKEYFHTTDLKYLKEIVDKSPPYQVVKDSNSSKIHFLAPNEMNEMQVNYYSLKQKYHNAFIVEISHLVFSPNGEKCLLYYHILENSGITIEFTKNKAGKWIVTEKFTEFLE